MALKLPTFPGQQGKQQWEVGQGWGGEMIVTTEGKRGRFFKNVHKTPPDWCVHTSGWVVGESLGGISAITLVAWVAVPAPYFTLDLPLVGLTLG